MYKYFQFIDFQSLHRKLYEYQYFDSLVITHMNEYKCMTMNKYVCIFNENNIEITYYKMNLKKKSLKFYQSTAGALFEK